MDVKSSEKVLAHYLDFVKGVTSILVTHHLSSARHADRIFVLEKGQLVEQGSHDQLMTLNAHYAGLFNTMKNTYR
jgi:ATP-binding cassette subfamily B protein